MTRPYTIITLRKFTTCNVHLLKCVKSTDFKLCLITFSDLNCFNINESEFQQSIDLQKKDDKTQLGRLKGFIRIHDDQ